MDEIREQEDEFYNRLSKRLSKRAIHALRNSDRVHDMASLLAMTDEDLSQLWSVGKKTLRELQEFRREISSMGQPLMTPAEEADAEQMALVRQLLPFFQGVVQRSPHQTPSMMEQAKDMIAQLLASGNVDVRKYGETADDVLSSNAFWREMFQTPQFQQFFAGYLRKCTDRYYSVSREELDDRIQRDFPAWYRRLPVSQMLEDLMASGDLIREHGGYRAYRISVRMWLQQEEKLSDREKEFFCARAEGRTLDEIGQESGLTRERVRQIVNKAVHHCPETVREGQFLKLFQQYAFDDDIKKTVFGIDSCGCIYLDEKLKHANQRLNAEEALKDKHIPSYFRRALQRYLHQDDLYVDGTYLRPQRTEVLRYFLQHECRDEISAEEFLQRYQDFLERQGRGDDPRLVLKDRYATSTLTMSHFVLWKYGQKLRAYDLDEVDIETFVQDFHFGEFHDVVVSAQIFLDRYPEEARRYDIRDAYEFHNLLRKRMTKEKELLEKYKLEICPMPTLRFGTASEPEQAMQLIEQEAPIGKDALAERYREEYGIQPETFHSNPKIAKKITPYFHQGVYTLDIVKMTDEEVETLKGLLLRTFYLMDELRDILHKAFPRRKGILNRYNLGRAGFLLNHRTAYQSQYTGILTALRGQLEKQGVLTFQDYIGDYRNVLHAATADLDIIEFEEGSFISIGRFQANGIGKEDLRAIQQEILEQIGDHAYFTMKSFRQAGGKLSTDSLGFGDMFVESILRYSDVFDSQRIGRTWLFRQDEATFAGLLTDILEQESSIDIDDLKEQLEDDYGIAFKDLYKILEAAQNAGMYYNEIMRRVYRDYDVYYEEV